MMLELFRVLNYNGSQ